MMFNMWRYWHRIAKYHDNWHNSYCNHKTGTTDMAEEAPRMSMSYQGTEGFACVLSSNEWVERWNAHHDEDGQAEDYLYSYETDDPSRAFDDDNCEGIDITTSADGAFPASLGSFGECWFRRNPQEEDGVVVTYFAPRWPDYFAPAYSSIDEMVDDIIDSTEAFVPEDHDFVRQHLCYVSVVTYG